MVKHQPLFKPIKTRTVAKNIIEALGITRYHRRSGSFDFAKLFGERQDYFNYVYFPLKVLEHYGLIKHYKQGKVERIKERWEVQTKFVEKGG